MTPEIESKVNKLAERVKLDESFMNLPLKDKCLGIAVFAHIAGEFKVKEEVMRMYEVL